MVSVLSALKEKDLDAAVSNLDQDQQDVLMKYPVFIHNINHTKL